MADPLRRDWYDTLKDDDGSGTTGTKWNKAEVDKLLNTINASFGTFGPVDKVTPGTVLGRQAGTGPTQVIPLGTYVTLEDGKLDVAGAGDTAFIIQSRASAEAAWLRKHPGQHVPVDYLPNALPLSELQTGYLWSETGSGIVHTTAKLPVTDLADYAEQPFQPTLSASGSATGVTYRLQQGYAVKAGRKVTVQGRLQLATKGTLTGNLRIDGFPWPVIPAAPASLQCSWVQGVQMPGVSLLTAMLEAGQTWAALISMPSSPSGGTVYLTGANITNDFDVVFAASYIPA